MDLKELLGEELFQQVNEKIETAEDDVKLMVNDGSYVPRERLNDKNDKIELLEQQIKERDNQIEQLKNDTQTSEELQQKIEELQEKNEQTQKELEEKLQQQTLESEIDKALLKNNARNPQAVKALLDMEEVKLTDDGGVKGLDNQLEKLQEEESYLFAEEGGPAGGDEFKGGSGSGGLTMRDIDRMNEDEINENWEEVQKVLQNQ